MDQLKIIAFTHRKMSMEQIGWLHCEEDQWKERLVLIKEQLQIDEVVYISTCNRVEFALITDKNVDRELHNDFILNFKSELSEQQRNFVVDQAEVFNGVDAAEHLFRVASSIDSMVVGEREIITQVRKSFEMAREEGLAGNYLNVLFKNTIENAKRVYTETQIAQKPVSVVSLAYQRLKDLNVPLDSRVLIVGAGITNNNMAKFLYKHGFTNFKIFNRTTSKAKQLADKISADYASTEDLATHESGFDLLITCTGSEQPIITKKVYQNLLKGEDEKKIVIDLAIPKDTEKVVTEDFKLKYIDVERLRKVSQQNLAERSKEISKAEQIIEENLENCGNQFKQRALEVAMKDVPSTIKDIRATAINDIFAKDINAMDAESRETLEKIIAYMEKKYISLPMKMAREILIEDSNGK